jgi:hypothetical protein
VRGIPTEIIKSENAGDTSRADGHAYQPAVPLYRSDDLIWSLPAHGNGPTRSASSPDRDGSAGDGCAALALAANAIVVPGKLLAGVYAAAVTAILIGAGMLFLRP